VELRWRHLAYGALLISCILLLFLLKERDDLAERYAQLLEISDGPLQGRWYPVVAGRGLRGDSVCIANAEETPQFIFLFNAECGLCAMALRAWAPVLDSLLASGRIRAVGVALEEDSARAIAFVEDHDPPMPVVMLSHARWRSVFRVRTLPMMVILDADGRVRAARGGVPSEALVRDTILPGIDLLKPTDRTNRRSVVCVEH